EFPHETSWTITARCRDETLSSCCERLHRGFRVGDGPRPGGGLHHRLRAHIQEIPGAGSPVVPVRGGQAGAGDPGRHAPPGRHGRLSAQESKTSAPDAGTDDRRGFPDEVPALTARQRTRISTAGAAPTPPFFPT